MTIGKRILFAVIGGCVLAAAAIVAALYFNEDKVSPILLWHVFWFVKMAGSGPPLGVDSEGNQVYEGTPLHLLFGLIGLAATFPLYSIYCFLVLMLFNKFSRKRAKNHSSELK